MDGHAVAISMRRLMQSSEPWSYHRGSVMIHIIAEQHAKSHSAITISSWPLHRSGTLLYDCAHERERAEKTDTKIATKLPGRLTHAVDSTQV